MHRSSERVIVDTAPWEVQDVGARAVSDPDGQWPAGRVTGRRRSSPADPEPGDDPLPTLSHRTEFEKSGYFAVLEQPKLVVNDVRTFVRPLR